MNQEARSIGSAGRVNAKKGDPAMSTGMGPESMTVASTQVPPCSARRCQRKMSLKCVRVISCFPRSQSGTDTKSE